MFVDARRPRYISNLSAIRAAVTPRTKAIIINSPNNPTGAVYDRTTLENIGQLAINTQLWIISDECYSRFVFTGARRHVSIMMAHPCVSSRTIIVNGFSEELATSRSTRFCTTFKSATAALSRTFISALPMLAIQVFTSCLTFET